MKGKTKFKRFLGAILVTLALTLFSITAFASENTDFYAESGDSTSVSTENIEMNTQNPEKTEEAFVQNPIQSAYVETVYRTGDIGRLNEHGELVFVTRRDSQIKHMGHRIELGDIESSALKCPLVKRSCCAYDKEKKRIALFYVGECEPTELQKYLQTQLPRYMLPQICEKLAALPQTDNGKIDRKALRERAEKTE